MPRDERNIHHSVLHPGMGGSWIVPGVLYDRTLRISHIPCFYMARASQSVVLPEHSFYISCEVAQDNSGIYNGCISAISAFV